MTQSFREYQLQIAVITLLTTCSSAGISFALPKTYKSKAIISIYSQYFQNPLVKDFVGETYENNELRSQRESLIRLSLDDRFIDHIASIYHLYDTPAYSPQLAADRESVLRRFEITSINSNTYQIGFSGSSAVSVQSILRDTLEQISQTLMNERRRNRAKLRDAIRDRVELLSHRIAKSSSNSTASMSTSVLQKELESLNQRIEAASREYTPNHPEVARLKRLTERTKRLLNLEPETSSSTPGAPADTGKIDSSISPFEMGEVSPEIYNDLLKKYGYLNILMAAERDSSAAYFAIVENPSYAGVPVFPKKPFFLISGLFSGVVLSFFYMLLATYRKSVIANKTENLTSFYER